MDKNEFTDRVLEAEATLYHISKSILKNDSECADAVQEALIKAFAALHTLKDDKYFKTWLCRILINECYAICRSNKRVISLEEYMETGHPETPQKNYELYEAIMGLPAELRLAVVLHYIEGFRTVEVAGMLKIPEGTVKSRLSRARAELRTVLQEEVLQMKNSSFGNVFPDVPERFHNAVENALNNQISNISIRSINMKKRIVCVIAAVLVIGSVTAGAAYIFRWNEKLAERFSVNEKQQTELADNGAVATVDRSVSENGLTVKAVQTLGDKNSIYILLDVAAPEGTELTDDSAFEGFGLELDGDTNVSYFGGFIDGASGVGALPAASNERYYEIWIMNSMHQDLSGKTVRISFTDLQEDTGKLDFRTVLKGNWELSWPLEFTNNTKKYEIDRSYEIAGQEVAVESIELSPLSMTVNLDGEGLNKLYTLLNVDECNSMFSASILTKDGNSFTDFGGPGSEGLTDSEAVVYTRLFCFDKVLDTDNVDSVTLTFPTGNEADTIVVSLKD